MTGLEKIKLRIIDEANQAAAEKTAQAQQKAQQIAADAKTEAEKEAAAIIAKSEKDAAIYKERTQSSIDLQTRTQILKAKQEIISRVIEKACEKLVNADAESYFAFLLKLLEEYAAAGEGTICFGKKDMERLPADFCTKASEIAKAKGGTLEIAKEAANIENGFVLIYGGVEENCTIRSIFDAKRDELSDAVNRKLFA